MRECEANWEQIHCSTEPSRLDTQERYEAVGAFFHDTTTAGYMMGDGLQVLRGFMRWRNGLEHRLTDW